MKSVKIGAGIVTLALGLTLAACSNDEGDSGASSAAATTSAEASKASLRLDDAVVRAKGEDNDMTSIFGTLVNDTDEDVTVESFTTSLGEAQYQLHEVVDGVMREKSGGYTIPAHGSHELKPGGDHMMVMGYANPVAAGDEITVTLELSDGSSVELDPIPVRTIGAGDENYGDLDQGDQGEQGHGEHHH
ncbi:copper chaperone PCu(A)C [Corynebacterium lowii]|uniref:Copper chaperone PCu(A)C n=1 Tax=Corynebacterium lowii TaxID=1544413 RepID=A0A0Q0YVV0_9CORY|nr:copper chaperone PCu(A)C [Corynebacterium lowii]KQB86509.1 hypothetical protein Clow_00710 [Corynebacterium lowii]MDP9851189.1 copper(I)-binding protein [Corynebacterium lowii]